MSTAGGKILYAPPLREGSPQFRRHTISGLDLHGANVRSISTENGIEIAMWIAVSVTVTVKVRLILSLENMIEKETRVSHTTCPNFSLPLAIEAPDIL